MKVPVLTTLALLAVSPLAFSQEPAVTTPPAAGATADPAAKPKPLSSSDKSFLKKVIGDIYFLTNVTDRGKRDKIKNEPTRKIAADLNDNLNKIYGELGALVNDPKEMPTEVGGGDKAKLGRLDKTEPDKYDKEYFEVVAKNAKQVAKSLETASKSSQNETIKAMGNSWYAVVQNAADEAEKAAKAAAKAK